MDGFTAVPQSVTGPPGGPAEADGTDGTDGTAEPATNRSDANENAGARPAYSDAAWNAAD